ncbi:long chain acyl-CoA synthetase 4-like [Daucus carota subsp. sativus]|uniref:long chain acyl-CoA synthetase 4-like n=1 Tax=Daucus carota subsp. sativus TaxID=79200 RepID=UPI003082FA7A
MANIKRYIVEVEPGKPAMGPVYRSTFGVEPHIPGMESCWDIFRMSVEKYPDNPMLGHREIVDGKHGDYVWLTYKQVYDMVMKVGNAIRSCGVEKGGRCGIYGANSEGWIISMEACNAQGLYCVPLYDTLGASAVEFVICHAEVSIVFSEEKKITEVFKTFPKTAEYMKTIVSFGKVTSEQREEAAKLGVAIYSWNEFLVLGDGKRYELPVKKKSDICTIMYTSGTTGDPKGVLISNNSIVTIVAAVNRFLQGVNEPESIHQFYTCTIFFAVVSLVHYSLGMNSLHLILIHNQL